MKTTKTIIAVCIIALLLGCESKQTQQETYAAWCKLYGRTDITLEQWQLLRENYLLPGMEAQRAHDEQRSSTEAIILSTAASTALSTAATLPRR